MARCWALMAPGYWPMDSHLKFLAVETNEYLKPLKLNSPDIVITPTGYDGLVVVATMVCLFVTSIGYTTLPEICDASGVSYPPWTLPAKRQPAVSVNISRRTELYRRLSNSHRNYGSSNILVAAMVIPERVW